MLPSSLVELYRVQRDAADALDRAGCRLQAHDVREARDLDALIHARARAIECVGSVVLVAMRANAPQIFDLIRPARLELDELGKAIGRELEMRAREVARAG